MLDAFDSLMFAMIFLLLVGSVVIFLLVRDWKPKSVLTSPKILKDGHFSISKSH
ncbi:hypothetical protein B4064_3466 [Caldibacillus thermoamylovorans]|uniref:Uncharacterized protein n=1 Tax=Caldibacillus thermoamylovorans TaxID=35841 RepID=A0ABD4A8W1_9BACI|nr:hypothetical protein B4064_3466 [Caldibacillus thermoamylovorans]KIO73258.1 hypothetical protein B4167_2304 [Caldibacillus thermoamylovorans]